MAAPNFWTTVRFSNGGGAILPTTLTLAARGMWGGVSHLRCGGPSQTPTARALHANPFTRRGEGERLSAHFGVEMGWMLTRSEGGASSNRQRWQTSPAAARHPTNPVTNEQKCPQRVVLHASRLRYSMRALSAIWRSRAMALTRSEWRARYQPHTALTGGKNAHRRRTSPRTHLVVLKRPLGSRTGFYDACGALLAELATSISGARHTPRARRAAASKPAPNLLFSRLAISELLDRLNIPERASAIFGHAHDELERLTAVALPDEKHDPALPIITPLAHAALREIRHST